MKVTEFKPVVYIIMVCIALLGTCGCVKSGKDKSQEPELREMKKFWFTNLHEGNIDSVITITRPYYNRVKGKSERSQALAGLHLAQAYTIKENADSALYYLHEATPLVKRLEVPVITILYYNVKGGLDLKYNLDYPASLNAYNEGLKVARNTGNIRGISAMLASIVYIYYVIGDPHGMEYAIEARTIVDSIGNGEPIAAAHSWLAMGLMNATNGNLKGALQNLESLDSILKSAHLNQLVTISNATRGDIFTRTGNYAQAEEAYERALEYMPYAEHSIGVMALFGYGREKEKRGDARRADSLYREALILSKKYNNLEFRGDILLALAKLHLKNDERKEALEYFESYHNHIDSLHKTRMVQDFNNLILKNHNLEKQTEVQKYRIAHLHAQKVAIGFIALVAILTAVIISMLFFYRKKRKLYKAQARRLMEQNRLTTSELVAGEGVGKDGVAEASESFESREDPALSGLFALIERKMKTDKIYRSRNLSLESLAETLNTNRTYVSRAVNTRAGVSFSSYVNSYRISEAIALLSDPESDILVKELADRVGFSSDSVFSRIFKKETGMTPKEFRQSAILIAREKGSETDEPSL